MILRVGDVIFREQPDGGIVRRMILETRLSGYTWCLPDISGDETFLSENSNDPFFEMGWEKENTN